MKNKIFGLILLFVLSGSHNLKAEIIGRQNFNQGWKFKLLNDKTLWGDSYESPGLDDADWEAVSLPHTARLESLVVNNQWQGICWYRKTFPVSADLEGKKLLIELEAAMNYSQVWINGNEVSEHHGGYLPVVIDITDHILFGERNMIAVRLNNMDNPITGPKPLKILDFNMYGGLYRNAWMIVKDKVHVSHSNEAGIVAGGGIFITYPKVSAEESVVRVKTHIENDDQTPKSVKVVQSVVQNGLVVAGKKSETLVVSPNGNISSTVDIPVSNPMLWSPGSPNMYSLETTVLVDGTPVDKQETRFGIREFRLEKDGLYINGEKTFLRGVNRHQEYPFVGYALSDNAQYRDAKKIKEGGFNYIRLSHYPQSPAFMDACDELGIVVLDAILGWQYYADNDHFRNYCYRSAKELIRRDRNHPCVLGWEVSLNETQMPIFFQEELHRIAHVEYPSTYTYTAGWMDGVYDIFLQARQHKIGHSEDYENRDTTKFYSVSEYGDWEYYSSNAGLNQHKMDKTTRYETSSRQKRGYGEARLLNQCRNVQEAHSDNLTTAAFADSYWVMYDYNRGYHDDIEYSGLMDIFRLPKYAYYFYQSQESPEVRKVLEIASYWNERSPLDVKVFSNSDEVELYLNGELIARQNPDSDSISANLSHPPFTFKMETFEPGELKAVGYIEGDAVAESVVRTPKKPTALKIWLDESGRRAEAGCNDVLFLYIAAVDENGTINPNFDGEINLEINENAEIMNQGAIKAEAGIATALVRIKAKAGEVKVIAKAESLQPSASQFKVAE
ncbi:glycoside hydrolase family 2 TIM barrel-domain containing protein [Mangrovibacterium sp.]|uniref:glycoside hydrolase family 2 protein n=1 Tax=Mangrovibacterium sp. TaxID=1961364 RepID=UPI0035692FFC